MVVNFEFLGNEPIENVITCMNFQCDKTVFFGYNEVIQKYRDTTVNFLKKYCGVQQVVFHALSHNNLQSILKTMRKEIEYELVQNNEIYFDVTGGESLILIAFGIISTEFDAPMHLYDIVRNELIELDEGAKREISRNVPAQKVKLDIDRYIELKGGVINYNLQSDLKDIADEEFENDVANMWQVAKKFGQYWNPFSEFLRNYMIPDVNLYVSKNASYIVSLLMQSESKLKTPAKLNEILDDLADAGLLTGVQHANGRYAFRFKNQNIKDCIWEGGSILELHTFQKERKISDDCKVGVHIDWDGKIHYQAGMDVLNEVDVMSLTGNIPTFISCKTGKMGSNQTLHALYELETVTRRFGGKYAKKVLVTAQPLGDIYLERAEELGIEVR